MLTITDAQLNAYIAFFIWPFLRIYGVLLSDPFLSSASIPVTVRVGFGLLITMAIAPMLPPMPVTDIASAVGVLIGINQLIIGVMIGLVMRLIFTAVELAGNLAGLQMGLGFASFYDPQNNSTEPVLAQFLSAMIILLFLSMNGHLIVLRTLIDSFTQVPVSVSPLPAAPFRAMAEQGALVLRSGLQLSMPVLGSLLVANLAVGVMTRASPQLNIFAIGFPIMLIIGMGSMMLTLPAIPHQFTILLDGYTRLVDALMHGLGPVTPPVAR